MSEQQTNGGPLEGLVVLDLTRILAGPTATQLMGDLGAEVIKIERPGAGDDTRAWGPPYVTDAEGRQTRESAYYLSSNRNKRSVSVDIATPEGAALVRRLALQADVLVENFKVGGLAKYGLAYADLAAEAPRLIYCSITGFGQTGPNARRAGYDLLAQGYGGIMSLTGAPDGPPMKVGVGVADVVCGLYAVSATLAALHWRERSGRGQHVDVALVDSAFAWLVNEGVNYLSSGRAPERRGNAHPNIVPYDVFAAADGHIIVAVGNDGQFRRFAEILGAPGWADDPRFASNPARVENRAALTEAIAARLAGRAGGEVLAAMEAAGVPGGPINRLDEAFGSDQAQARGMTIAMPHPLAASGEVALIGNPLKLSQTPVSYRRAPPVLGADTREVIVSRLGAEAYAAAKAAGALGEESGDEK
ncbi:MAG: CoA transferase [Pseudomonadota bacterium]